jgi:hypothetical protein
VTSIRQERVGSAVMAAMIRGKRWLKSLLLRVISRTPGYRLSDDIVTCITLLRAMEY